MCSCILIEWVCECAWESEYILLYNSMSIYAAVRLRMLSLYDGVGVAVCACVCVYTCSMCVQDVSVLIFTCIGKL